MKLLSLRRLEAEHRQARRAGRSPQQQLQILESRPGLSHSERERISQLCPVEQPAPTNTLTKQERKALRHRALSA